MQIYTPAQALTNSNLVDSLPQTIITKYNNTQDSQYKIISCCFNVTFIGIGHCTLYNVETLVFIINLDLLRRCVRCTAGIFRNYAGPLTAFEMLNYYLILGMSSELLITCLYLNNSESLLEYIVLIDLALK